MRQPLGLKRTVETGKVKQSFSHGRSNTVVVEVKRRRVLGPNAGGPAEAPVVEEAPAPAPAPAPAAGPRPGRACRARTVRPAAFCTGAPDAVAARGRRTAHECAGGCAPP